MCREGDVVALNTLLETSQPNLDHSNAKGLSALHYAARNNHAEVIELLINHGAGWDIHLYSLISVTCMLASGGGGGVHDITRGGEVRRGPTYPDPV